MRVFLKILFAFIYCCLTLFISQNSVHACNTFIQNTQTLSYISQPKTEITFTNKHEETYLVSNNQNRCQITKTTNKNYNYGSLLGEKPFLEEYILNNYILAKNGIITNRIAHKISPKLKHAIYTRAP